MGVSAWPTVGRAVLAVVDRRRAAVGTRLVPPSPAARGFTTPDGPPNGPHKDPHEPAGWARDQVGPAGQAGPVLAGWLEWPGLRRLWCGSCPGGPVSAGGGCEGR